MENCTNGVYETRIGRDTSALSEPRARGAFFTMTEHDALADSISRLDRRAFVSRAGLVAAGVFGATLLEACGPASAPAPASTSAPAPTTAAAPPTAAGAAPTAAAAAPAPAATSASGGSS